MSVRTLQIGSDRRIGPGEPALVVAEIGQNHNGDVRLAEQLIDAAAWAGADAVKLVKRDLDCELSREARQRPYCTPHSFGPTYGEHRAVLELGADVHRALCSRAREHGLLYFATACDIPSAELLADLSVDVFKIASRDLPNHPLLEHVAAYGRPMFLSTGMSDLAEIDAAVRVIRKHNCPLLVMQCTSLYPTPPEDVHLRSLNTLAVRYGVPVGFSDHTRGTLLAPVAVAMGAAVIEKHFTLDRTLKGTDHACSLEPEELRRMIADLRQVEAALGRGDKPRSPATQPVRAKLGRSLVARSALKAGTVLEEHMLALKCPGTGLNWSQRNQIVGRVLRRDVQADDRLSLDDMAGGAAADSLTATSEFAVPPEFAFLPLEGD